MLKDSARSAAGDGLVLCSIRKMAEAILCICSGRMEDNMNSADSTASSTHITERGHEDNAVESMTVTAAVADAAVQTSEHEDHQVEQWIESPKLGDTSTCPEELVIIPRDEWLNAAEEELSIALVALVGRTRPETTTQEVRDQLITWYAIEEDKFTISRYYPEDFLVRFQRIEDVDKVLVTYPPRKQEAAFHLLWYKWSRHTLATSEPMKYKVQVGIKGIPQHAWGIPVAQRILGTSCAKLVEAPSTETREDLKEYYVAAWCVHQSRIPQKKTIVIPEPEKPHIRESPLYLKEDDIIHAQLKLSITELKCGL